MILVSMYKSGERILEANFPLTPLLARGRDPEPSRVGKANSEGRMTTELACFLVFNLQNTTVMR